MKLEYLKKECLLNDIFLEDVEALNIIKFLDFMLEYNKFVNLTSILKFEDIVYKHIIDSLLLLKVIKIEDDFKMLDIGAGAGFPSTPIAIVKKKFKSIVQMDSLKKRVDFLNKVKCKLNLNVSPYCCRAEDAAKKSIFRENFNIVTARAVAKLNILCELALPFVEIGGVFVALKGPDYFKELEDSKKVIELLGGFIEKIETFKLKNKNIRKLILIKKISHTSSKYPRSFSKILKNPI